MNELEKYRPEIDAVKFAIETLPYLDISMNNFFRKIVMCYKEYYNLENNKKYLLAALIHIQAYLEMGFCYCDNEDIFNEIVRLYGSSKEQLFPKRFYYSKKVVLNKSQVRKMIRRWPASRNHKMSINEVVDDIIDKVKNRIALSLLDPREE